MAQFELSGVSLDVPDALLTPRIHEKLRKGRYEWREARAAQLSIDYGDRVLELGSGVGYIATIAAMLAGPENLLTVEANPDLLPVIRANLDTNGCAEAELLHGAVTGAVLEREVAGFQRAHGFWASSLGDGGNSLEVPALNLHNLLERHRPTVVLMDVEGAEQNMFDQLLPKHVRVVTLELHPKRYDAAVIKRIFDGMSASGLAYAPDLSNGKIVGFCRIGQTPDGT